MSIVSAITTYFSHNNYVTHHLKEELKISVASRLLGQCASHHSQFTLAASTRFNAASHQGLSNLIQLQWVFFSFHFTLLLNGIRQNLSEGTLSQDWTVWNFSWISTTWINFSPPLHMAWRLLRDRIKLVLMYFMYTLVLQWILWQCFRTDVSFQVIQHSLSHHQARYWNFDIQIALSTNITRQHLMSSIADSITS